jgi:hypothetical protein
MFATAERAIDVAISRGAIPKTLPFIRREAIKAVKSTYQTQDMALDAIARTLREFYRTRDAGSVGSERPEVERAVAGTSEVYERNVFPEMRVTFGTYSNNIGHIDAPGCFRCHDETHKTTEGRAIGQDCETCHAIE